MKILKVLMLAIFVLVLTGASCSNSNVRPDQVEIDPSLRQRCPGLPIVNIEEMNMGDLYVEYGKLQGQYIECAIRHDCLIEASSAGDKKIKITCPTLKERDEKEEAKTE